MPTPTPRKRLPIRPSLEHLKKQARRRTRLTPSLQLAESQHQLAREYGCHNWAELVHVVETMSRGADQLEGVKQEAEPLPGAARRRDLDQVCELLAAGQYTPHDLDLALGHAVCYGAPSTWPVRKIIADLLIEHGADPDGQWGSAYGPIVFGTGECVQPEGLKYLIEAGADVTFPPVDTKYGKQCPLSQILGTYGRGANARKHAYIDLLLKHGAVIPPEVSPALLAVHRGDSRQLVDLLERDPSLLTRRFPEMPYGNMELRGATLLHCAVEFGENDCIAEMLRRGADINARADVVGGIGGQTPIFHAIGTITDGNIPTLEFLAGRADLGIDMNVRATWRRFGQVQSTALTPLEFAEAVAAQAAEHGRSRVTEELVLLRRIAGLPE
jgi:hypothetical protein